MLEYNKTRTSIFLCVYYRSYTQHFTCFISNNNSNPNTPLHILTTTFAESPIIVYLYPPYLKPCPFFTNTLPNLPHHIQLLDKLLHFSISLFSKILALDLFYLIHNLIYHLSIIWKSIPAQLDQQISTPFQLLHHLKNI